MSVRPKSVCDSCSATFIIVHELPEEEYTEQYCPFCGEEHEEIQESELKIQYLKETVDVLREIINNLNWRHQTIGNMIKWRQFEAGG